MGIMPGRHASEVGLLMELRHIRYFIAVAETGSVTVAAERRLHTSQPSLSRQIRDLEDEVGAPLLNRSARGVELTDAGRAFMDHARLALMQIDAAIEAARKAAQPAKERFALGFLTGEEMRWLPEAMQILRGELPNADVSVTSDYSPNLADAVARGKLDVAFLRAEPDFDLVYRTVRQEPLVVLMPSDHPLASRRAVRPQDLIGEPFIAMGGKARMLRGVIDEYRSRSGVQLTSMQFADSPATEMWSAACGKGALFISVPSWGARLVRETARRYDTGLVPTTIPKCSRITAADPNPTSAATCSMARSVVSSSRCARRTRACASHAAGVAPSCSRKRRLRVLVLIAARRAMTANGSSRERFCSIHVTNGGMAPGASDGGACSMNCACPPARSSGITASRATDAAMSAPRSRRTM